LEEVPVVPETTAPEPAIALRENEGLGVLDKLPPFGPVVIRLLHLCEQRDVELAEVVRLVESDPVMASEVLALVNSPLFAVSGPVTSPGHAVTMLGVDRTRALTTSLAVRFMAQRIPDKNMFRRVWRHSLATAVVARRVAGAFQVDENLVHTAATLHDLGRLGLMAAYKGAYMRLATKSYETREDIITAEEAQFGMSHCKAGGLIARAWGFPETLQTVIAHHHERPAQRDVFSLVQTSCELAGSLGFESIHCWDVDKPASVIQARVPSGCRDEVLAVLDNIQNTINAHVEELDF
jgi:putative nucleotidyltransferase with HDIG domain